MGGMGSGRRYQGGKNTTTDMGALDIRYLKSHNLLTPGRTVTVTWSRCGTVVASIQITTYVDRIRLSYRHQGPNGDWHALDYPVYLEKTSCQLGGQRTWFLCPAQGCGKRVAILYGGKIFACRHCHQLVHASTRENGTDRASRKADRIREKLGWEVGILNPNGIKPKGMHWNTFHRLQLKHDKLVNQSLTGIMHQLRLFQNE